MIPIALARTPFKEKFVIPRQPALASAAQARIELLEPFADPLALVGLEQVSHIWLIFEFHVVGAKNDSLRVRPPRLGGNEKIGVFASRSTHRPNGLGMSVVKLERIEGCTLHVSGVDLLDGTPIVDIKPYVPYADSLPQAHNHLAQQPPPLLEVRWQAQAQQDARLHATRLNEPVVELIEQCLAQDPKPAYQTPDPQREYGVQLWDFNLRWRYLTAQCIEVLSLRLNSGDTPAE